MESVERVTQVLLRGLTAAVFVLPATARAQDGRGATNTSTSAIDTRSSHMADGLDLGPEGAILRERRENARKTQRMERLSASANRLVELTKQFQAGIATHPELTPEDAKRLDDIAKMAREVRSRMME